MYATEDILSVWRKFDDFPMETLTKAWYFHKAGKKKQRDVSLMKEHRAQYGNSGNCFDLAIWLLDEFAKNNIKAYPIGHDIGTLDAHVAVIAVNHNGNRYLCDLGDLWLNPVLVDSDNEDFTEGKLSGFFTAADIQIQTSNDSVQVLYHRPNGKCSKQQYDLKPIDMDTFLASAEQTQNYIEKPLLEYRIPYKKEIAHWEFYDWKSFLSTTEGLFHDPIQDTIEQWADVIHQKTGINKQFLVEALIEYQK